MVINITDFAKKSLFGCGFAVLFLFLVVCISNLILGTQKLSPNDLHMLWIVQGRNFFIPSNAQNQRENVLLEINPEQVLLDNKYISFFSKKEPGTFRIFCIGSSITQGWPFHKRLSYPQLLSLYLKDVLPENKTEVINAGVFGSDSFSDYYLAKEIRNYQPDLILLYEGRNEAGNLRLHTGFPAKLLKIQAWLFRNCSLSVFLRDYMYPGQDDKFDHAQTIRNFVGRNFKYKYNVLKNVFFENMVKIIRTIKRDKCDVILLTQVVSREKGEERAVIWTNPWIRELASAGNIGIIDIDKAFSASETPGKDLVIPVSVHPDLDGHILMAKTVCSNLYSLNMIAPKDKWKWNRLKSDQEYLRRLDVTPAFLAETYKRVAGMFMDFKMPDLADRYSKKAERYSAGNKLFERKK